MPSVQLVQASARVVENLPTLQMLQFTASPPLNLPASQELQVVAPLLVPVKDPLEHSIQSSSIELGAYLPSVHDTHSFSSLTKDPAGQEPQLERSS